MIRKYNIVSFMGQKIYITPRTFKILMYYISFTGTAEQFISLLLITNSLFTHKNLQSTNEKQKNMVLNVAGLPIFLFT